MGRLSGNVSLIVTNSTLCLKKTRHSLVTAAQEANYGESPLSSLFPPLQGPPLPFPSLIND